MLRLWITEQQAKTLRRALRAHITTLNKCAEESHIDKDFDIEAKYVNEANALDDILDIIDKSLSNNEYIVKDNENFNKCGNCKNLICKDVIHHEGICKLTRLYRRFTDLCVHDEDIM